VVIRWEKWYKLCNTNHLFPVLSICLKSTVWCSSVHAGHLGDPGALWPAVDPAPANPVWPWQHRGRGLPAGMVLLHSAGVPPPQAPHRVPLAPDEIEVHLRSGIDWEAWRRRVDRGGALWLSSTQFRLRHLESETHLHSWWLVEVVLCALQSFIPWNSVHSSDQVAALEILLRIDHCLYITCYQTNEQTQSAVVCREGL